MLGEHAMCFSVTQLCFAVTDTTLHYQINYNCHASEVLKIKTNPNESLIKISIYIDAKLESGLSWKFIRCRHYIKILCLKQKQNVKGKLPVQHKQHIAGGFWQITLVSTCACTMSLHYYFFFVCRMRFAKKLLQWQKKNKIK